MTHRRVWIPFQSCNSGTADFLHENTTPSHLSKFPGTEAHILVELSEINCIRVIMNSVLKYQNRDHWHKKQWTLRTVLSSDAFVVSVNYCCIIGLQKSKWFNWMPLLLKEATRCGVVLNSTGFLMIVESAVRLWGGF